MSGAVIILQQNRLMQRFREMGAISPATAKRLEELGLHDHWIFRRMSAKGVFVRVDEDRFYMDPTAQDGFIRRRHLIVFTTTAILLIIFIVVMFFLRQNATLFP